MNIYCTNEKIEPQEPYDYYIDLSDKKKVGYAFWDKILKFPKEYSPLSIDLLFISIFVFCTDRLITRETQNDSWIRKACLNIPVSSPDFWDIEKNSLITLLNFLSGDKWDFIFRQKEFFNEKKYYNSLKVKKVEVKNYKYVCMLSGGLDSYIGAIDLLESQNKNILFVSHYGGGKGTKEYQDAIFKILKDIYKLNKKDYIQYYVACKHAKEDSTRTRSFMFFSHAIALASAMKDNVKLIIPENGFISLNIPITQARFGSSSTRTTHPFYMNLLRILVKSMGLNLEIINPYQTKTKGEMIKECKNISLLEDTYFNTMSCSHPDQGRYKGIKYPIHCGCCIPCIIRRAAINEGFCIDRTEYLDEKINLNDTAKINKNAYNLMLKRNEMTNTKLLIQESGVLEKDILEIANMFDRGVEEIKNFFISLEDE